MISRAYDLIRPAIREKGSLCFRADCPHPLRRGHIRAASASLISRRACVATAKQLAKNRHDALKAEKYCTAAEHPAPARCITETIYLPPQNGWGQQPSHVSSENVANTHIHVSLKMIDETTLCSTQSKLLVVR
jgi:hypothetical protein